MRAGERLKTAGWRVKRDEVDERLYEVTKSVREGEVSLDVEESKSDAKTLVIKGMRTMPQSKRGKGSGSKVLKELIGHARDAGYTTIIAHKVYPAREEFWKRAGFKRSRVDRLSDFQLRV